MTAPSSVAADLVLPCDIETLRSELCEARNAQQTAEIALAHEREANVTEAVRAAIDDAIRSQREACSERDRVQRDCKQAQVSLEKAQRVIRNLEYELARLFLENRLLERENEELTALKPSVRYSPLVDNPARHRRRRCHIPSTNYRTRAPTAESPCGTTPHPTQAPLSPLAPPEGLLNEEAHLPPRYDYTSFISWANSPPPDTMEYRHTGLGLGLT